MNRAKVNDAVILSMERTLDQDVAYCLRLLVDMAERSLSDSPRQDPTTAVQAIDRLHDCLRQLVRRPLPDGRHLDGNGDVRLIERVMSWDAYVHLAFDEIRLAGAGSPPVARRLQAALRDLRSVANAQRRIVLEEQLELLGEGTDEVLSAERDVSRAGEADLAGMGSSSS